MDEDMKTMLMIALLFAAPALASADNRVNIKGAVVEPSCTLHQKAETVNVKCSKEGVSRSVSKFKAGDNVKGVGYISVKDVTVKHKVVTLNYL